MNDDIVERIRQEMNTSDSGIIVHKYIVEIKIYPNGEVYNNMFPIGKTMQQFKKKAPERKEKEIQLGKAESY